MDKVIIDDELPSINIKDAEKYINKKDTIVIAYCAGRHENFLFLVDTYTSYIWVNQNLLYHSSFTDCKEAIRHILKLGYEVKAVDRYVRLTVAGIITY